MFRPSFILIGLWIFLSPAQAFDRGQLQGLLAEAVDDDTAAVLHVSTPEGAITLTHGRKWQGGPPVEADDLFVLASVSKPYLAAAVLALNADGQLPLDRPVRKLLDARTAKGFPGLDRITVRMLLSMRSALMDYYTDDYLEELILPRRTGITLNRALGYARDEVLAFRPGKIFDYVNTNYLLAQAVLEKAAGMPMHQVFQERLFRPAGLTRTHVLNATGSPPLSVAGYEDLFGDGPVDVRLYYHAPGFGDGGLIASAADAARFFRALLIDRMVLPSTQLAAMLADPEGDEYGLGIDVEHDKRLGVIFGHSGGDLGFVSDVRVVPSKGFVVVALFGSVESNSDLTWRVLDALD
jgi:D-alanyl-D-alanine carboxypeptidase